MTPKTTDPRARSTLREAAVTGQAGEVARLVAAGADVALTDVDLRDAPCRCA
jgi:hypothetical protein